MNPRRLGLTLALICLLSLNGTSPSTASAVENHDAMKNVQSGRMLPTKTAESAYFGSSLSIDGDTAIVGAYESNSVHIYYRNQGGTDTWGAVKSLFGLGGLQFESFGFSVAMSGDIAVVGAPDGERVHVFYRNQGGANNWGKAKTIQQAFYPPGSFGLAVSLSGDTLVVGAPLVNKVYVFQRNQGGADNWGQVKVIQAADRADHDYFGASVSIRGDIVAVGAVSADISGKTDQGAAYVFNRNQGGANQWGQVKKIVAADGAAGDSFGNVSNYADKIVVGAWYATVNGKARQGAAYVFYRDRGGANNWGQVKKIIAADGAAQDYLGNVSIYGDTIAIGAQGADVGGNANQGAAYVFLRNQGGADSWGQMRKITASDGASGDHFGRLQVNGNTLIVGVPNGEAAYVFYRDRGGLNNWGQVKKLFMPDSTPPTNPTSLTSPSHAVNAWSKDTTVDVTWSGASDTGSGLDGYSILWDKAASTVPDAIKDVEETVSARTGPALTNGSWYFHIRAVDNAGNWAAGAAHLGPFKIDTLAPTNPTHLTSPSHTVNMWSNDDTIAVAWSGAADTGGSGVDGYSVLWDTSGTGVPDAGKDLEETASSTTSSALPSGNWYFHIRAIDNAGNTAAGAAHLGPFKIDATAPESTASSPAFALAPFVVQWFGTDAHTGITNYNVWVRDGPVGDWMQWLTATASVSATFTSGLTGHAYYFRSQARDMVGNLETDLPPDGDTHTTVAAYQVTGAVLNNRHQPIFNAAVTVDPPVLNVARTDGRGNYTAYFAASGTYSLTAAREGFGPLPPQMNLAFSDDATASDCVLPPANDAMLNGGFESGDLSGWTSDPAVTATVEMSAAHTGGYGLRLESSGSGSLDFEPSITQTVAISSGWSQPTLSWLYQVTQANSGDALVVVASSESTVLTTTLPITPGAWLHDWVDLSAFSGQTITLRFGFQTQAVSQELALDEVSVGDSLTGAYNVYLPLVMRSP
jgi:hypothetical protein